MRIPAKRPRAASVTQDLRDVVDFCDAHFVIGFTPQEKSDLIAFLRSL